MEGQAPLGKRIPGRRATLVLTGIASYRAQHPSNRDKSGYTLSGAISVIIPAHNEESIIESALTTLISGSIGLEVEIVVVANGCSDRTADRARSVPGVVVLEIDSPSKIAALNLGDRAASHFPRVYVDADVSMSSEALAQLWAVLTGDVGARVAAPTMRVDARSASPLVRLYYKAWALSEFRVSGHVGSGVYALSEEGRRRFGSFPDVIADDRYVQQLFDRDERIVLQDAYFTVSAPRNMSSMIARSVRILVGNASLPDEVRSAHGGTSFGRFWKFLRRVLRRPSHWAPFAVYTVAFGIAYVQSKLVLRSGRPVQWRQDRTTR